MGRQGPCSSKHGGGAFASLPGTLHLLPCTSARLLLNVPLYVCLLQVCDVHRRLQDMSIEVRPALCLLPRCSARCLCSRHHAQKQGQVITGGRLHAALPSGCLFVSHSMPAFLNVSLSLSSPQEFKEKLHLTAGLHRAASINLGELDTVTGGSDARAAAGADAAAGQAAGQGGGAAVAGKAAAEAPAVAGKLGSSSVGRGDSSLETAGGWGGGQKNPVRLLGVGLGGIVCAVVSVSGIVQCPLPRLAQQACS